MITILVAAMLSQSSGKFVDDPPASDAPVQDPGIHSVAAGAEVPYDAICMTIPRAVGVAKELVDCRAQLEMVESKTVLSTPVLVGGIVGIIVAALVVGAGLGYVASPGSQR